MFRLILLLVSLVFASNVLARSLDHVIESGYIEIALYSDYPPYSYLDSKGEAQGVDVELGKLIAKELGVTPKWFWFSPDENLEDDLRNVIWKGNKIQRKIADLMLRVPYDSRFSHAIDGYGLPKNDLVVIFGPYQMEQWYIARDLKKTEKVRNLAIFTSQKVGVEIDTLPDFYLSSAFAGKLRKNVVHYKGIPSASEALVKGEVAAVVGLKSQLQWTLKDKGFDLSKDGLEQIVNREWDIGMAVRHDFRQLGYRVGDIVKELIDNKTLEKVFKHKGIDYTLPLYYQEEAQGSAKSHSVNPLNNYRLATFFRQCDSK